MCKKEMTPPTTTHIGSFLHQPELESVISWWKEQVSDEADRDRRGQNAEITGEEQMKAN